MNKLLSGICLAIAISASPTLAHAEDAAPACQLTLDQAKARLGEPVEMHQSVIDVLFPVLGLAPPPAGMGTRIYVYLNKERVLLLAVRPDGCVGGVAKGSRKTWDAAIEKAEGRPA